MCGIAGVAGWGDAAALARMTDTIHHRGPDAAGQWGQHLPDGTYIGLASRRLAILDLSPAGHMPMASEDGTVWLTYNGEIYNFGVLRAELQAQGHRFRSHSDTEVLLRLYEVEGPGCVRRLNGMFAFAVVDLRGGSPLLMLARDHFGVKPLYYVQREGRLAFASEIKALLQLPALSAEVDLVALHQYLTFLWVPDPLTLFRGIYKLPAGHYALFRGGRLSLVQYWDLAFPPGDTRYPAGEAELSEEIRARFSRAVRSQMVSDVPIGAFLSAGLDSSAIVATMARATDAPVRTYTITFPAAYRVGEITLDNPQVAARLARQLGCEHHEIVVEPAVVDLLPRLVWHMDEPIADPAAIMAYLVCREARRDVTVLLAGVGGDELFAGYRRHYAQRWAGLYRRLPAPLRRGLIEPALARAPALRGTPLKGWLRLARKLQRSAALAPQEAFLMHTTVIDAGLKSSLYAPELSAALVGADPWERHRDHFARIGHADFLHQMLYLETKTFMPSLNLAYSDKMSMASSVEVRVPFLDRELAEFVAQHVPPQLKLAGLVRPATKHIFRKAMRGILPQEVLRQPKAGFGAPADYWLNHDLREMVDDLLAEERVRARGLFAPGTVRRLVAEHRAGRCDWSLQLWQLLTLELWMQTFIRGNAWKNH